MERFSLSVLANNTALPGHDHEFGFSVHIATPSGASWLWDTGQSGTFMDNAARMGVNLRAMDGIALSHGHYDHVGGLRRFFSKYPDFGGVVVSHPDAGIARFSLKEGKPPKSIGPQTVSAPWPPPSWKPVAEPTELAPGLTFATPVPRIPGRRQSVAGFFLDTLGARADAVPDDAFLLLNTEHGPAVLLGCCHAGLSNTLALAARLAGRDRIHTLIGGMHLFDAEKEVLAQALMALKEHEVQRLYPAHCTGDDAIAWLRNHFSGKLQELKAGDRITL